MRGATLPTYITEDGYQALLEQRKKLEYEISRKKAQLGEAVKADPDLPENAEFKALHVELMFTLPKQIADIDSKLESVVIFERKETGTPDSVEIGTSVTVDCNGEVSTYKIGGANESNPDNGLISYETPLAQSLMGASVGEKRNLTLPKGTVCELVVIAIKQ